MAAATASQWPVIVLGLWKTLVLLYDVLTLPLFLLLQRPWLVLQRASRIKAQLVRRDDPYSPWVRIGSPTSECDILFQDVHNLGDFYRKVMKHHSKNKCYGYREVFAEEEEKQPKRAKSSANYSSAITTRGSRTKKQIARLKIWLPDSLLTESDREIVWCCSRKTRPEWILSFHALVRIGATVTTLYATLGDDGGRSRCERDRSLPHHHFC